MVEQPAVNRRVAGSSPASGANDQVTGKRNHGIQTISYYCPSAQWLVACPVFVKLRAMRYFVFCLCLGLTAPIFGAEIKINFSDFATGQTPTNFHSVLAGDGQPGEWKVIEDE